MRAAALGLRRVVWLAGIAGLVACAPTTLRSGLDEGEANRVLVALDAAAILATKAPDAHAGAGRYRIDVASGDAPRALRVLAATLPDHPQPGIGDLYAKPGLVPTLGEERARWMAAVAGELARSIRAIEGVHDARVHLAVVDASGAAFDAPPVVPRASVLVRLRPGAAPVDEHAVRALVSGAVDGLSSDRIAIVQAPTPSASVPLVHMVRVGPLQVPAASLPGVKLALGSALALNGALAATLIVLLRRRRG